MVADKHQQNMPSQPRSIKGRLFTGFAILGAPLAWALHFNVMYFLVQPICRLGGEVWFHVTTGAMLMVCVAVAFAAWKHRSPDATFEHLLNGTGTWRAFIVVYGLASAALFAYAILYQWSPVLTFGACDGTRVLQ